MAMIDSIQNMQSSPCGTGACTPSADPQKQAPISRASQSADTVKISKQGREHQNEAKEAAAGRPGESELDPKQQQEVNELKKIDQQIKAHEQAHMAAGAGLVKGGASYHYREGPDGKSYAVGGEVKIDTSREKDPQDTITKMQQVKRAALAPSQPSGQDQSVAARASQIEAEARIELLKEKAEEEERNDATDETSSNRIFAANPNAYKFSSSEPTIKVVA
jgi:hypothetical protein